MPCTYDPSPQEIINSATSRYKKELDRLTVENDRMREIILGMLEGKNPSKKELDVVYRDQVKHRKEDLARLKKAFTESRDAERLGKVMLADPKKPLLDQLGFDPDDF